ncbi:MAG: hypothetical protein ACKOYH_05975, partial [Cyanobium sp.]
MNQGRIIVNSILTNLLRRARELSTSLRASGLITPCGWPSKRPRQKGFDPGNPMELEIETTKVFISY